MLVLEAQAQVGGAALTREFAPGFQVSACAHIVHQLRADVLRDLELEAHGLKWAARGMSTTALGADGACVRVGAEASGADAAAYEAYAAQMQRFAQALIPVLSRAPPRLGTSDWRDYAALARLGWQIRRLGRADMRDLLRIGGMNVYDLLQEQFDDPLLKGALGFDAVLGTNFGPRSPGHRADAALSAGGASGGRRRALATRRRRGCGVRCARARRDCARRANPARCGRQGAF